MPETDPTNLAMFFGRLHPALVHLPIGFLVVLAVLEVLRVFKRFRGALEARSVLMALIVISSIAAVVAGLMLEREGGYNEQLLNWHKWTGIGLAVLCIATAIAFWMKKRGLYATLLVVTLVMLVPSTHFGGSMTHGSEYVTAYAPQWVRTLARIERPSPATRPIALATAAAGATDSPATQPIDPSKAVAYDALVQPVLAKYCVSCHGPEKVKGDLRLDSHDAILKGGETGPAVVAGKSKESHVVARMLLPLDDDDHMPPDGKPQPTPEQIALVKWWVDAGASAEKTVQQLAPPADVSNLIAAALGAAPTVAAVVEKGAPPATAPAVAAGAEPAPLDSLAAKVNELSTKLGIIIEPVAIDQPWLDINTSTAKTFGDGELAQLEPLATNVSSLTLAGSDVTDSGLAVIASMPNLRRLRLERTRVTDAGMPHLAKLSKLEYLNLYGTAITDAGLEPLQDLPALQQVYLWRTKVDPAAAKAFAEAMIDQQKVETWKKQIAQLQAQIKAETVEVYHGVPAASQPATTTTAPSAGTLVAVNTVCPVSGKPIDATKFIDFEGKRIAFCCENCPKAFEKDPSRFKDKIKLTAAPAASAPATTQAAAAAVVAVNTLCPVSGKPIDATKFLDFEGKRIAFCCGNCPGAFKSDPAKFKDKLN